MSTRLRPFIACALALSIVTGLPAQEAGIPESDASAPSDESAPPLLEPEGEDAAAGEAEGAEPSSYVATSVTAGGGMDSGFLVGEDESSDTIYLLRPTLLLEHRPSSRTEAAFAYEPELERFADRSELSATHHAAAGRLRFDPTARSQIFAGASFLDGEDPSRYLADLAMVLPRGPYSQSEAFAGYAYRWKRTSLVVQVGYTRTEIEPTEGVFAQGVDQSEAVATVHASRTMTDRLALTASFAVSRPTSTYERGGLSGEGATSEERTVQSALLGMNLRPASLWRIGLSAGTFQSDTSSFLGSLEVGRTGDRFAFVLRYDQGPLSFGSVGNEASTSAGVTAGIPSSTVEGSRAQSVSLGLSARLATRLRWEQLLWTSRATLPQEEQLESVAASSRLVFELVERVGLYVQADHFQQSGAIPVDEFSRTRATLGVVIGLSGPPSGWGIRRESELLQSLFPGGRAIE